MVENIQPCFSNLWGKTIIQNDLLYVQEVLPIFYSHYWYKTWQDFLDILYIIIMDEDPTFFSLGTDSDPTLIRNEEKNIFIF